MKKITFALAAIAALFSNCPIYGQAFVTVQAPSFHNYSQLVAPTGLSGHNFMRGCFLITANELASLTTSQITSFAFVIGQGTGDYPVIGTIAIYIQNTNDVIYNKSSNYNTAILGMSGLYSGSMTIPAATTTNVIGFSLTTPFNYTGGGLYIAYDWTAAQNVSFNGAYYVANINNSGNMGAYTSNNAVVVSTLIASALRPSCRFGGINEATNEAGVMAILAPGEVAEALHVGHTVSALVRNGSANALTNVSVVLGISGANSFSDTQVVPTIAAGAVATVTFQPFNPTQPGTNYLVVSVSPDENNINNQLTWQQSMSCNKTANYPHNAIFNTSTGFNNGPGILSSKFNFNATTTISAVNFGISNDLSSLGASLYGVLMNNFGIIVAKTNTVVVTSAMLSTFKTFTFTAPQELQPNTDYYVGLAQPSGYSLLALAQQENFYDNRFYRSGINGGNLTNSYLGYLGYFAIEPILVTPPITITQASTVICQGESITLNASGLITYTWTASLFSPIDTPNNATITVTPTSNEIYHLNASDAVGCGGTASTPVTVNPCVGIKTNSAQSEVKIYPNPAVNSKSFVSGLEGTNTITVYNTLGQLVITKTTTDETLTIDLATQPTGNYMVRITDSDNHSKTIKILNQN